MIAHKKEYFAGVGMMVAFVVVLVLMFMPLYSGQNGLDYLDNLFNSISKGSAFKNIEDIRGKIEPFAGTEIEVQLNLNSEDQARQTSLLFQESGALVNVSGAALTVSGDLGAILANALKDAELMYANDSDAVQARYGYDARRALYNWWTAFKEMDRDLSRQKQFKYAKIATDLKKRAVEMAFNYYGIEPQRLRDRVGLVIFSLVFYVAYTLWYGFAILFMFEGWGLKLEH